MENLPGGYLCFSMGVQRRHESRRAADLNQSTLLVRGSRWRMPPITNELGSPAAHKVAGAEPRDSRLGWRGCWVFWFRGVSWPKLLGVFTPSWHGKL